LTAFTTPRHLLLPSGRHCFWFPNISLGVGLLSSRPTPNLEDYVSEFTSPGERAAQVYPRTLGSSGTSGSPFPVLTYLGTWGGRMYYKYCTNDTSWYHSKSPSRYPVTRVTGSPTLPR
jgi:hypothetical protein